jgi:hypothetical protein
LHSFWDSGSKSKEGVPNLGGYFRVFFIVTEVNNFLDRIHNRFNGYRIDGSWLDVSILLQEFMRFISFSSVPHKI